MHSHHIRTITAAALTAFALLVFAAPAPAQQDLRSPDARDAATRTHGETLYQRPAQDLRSPDTRDAALISQGLLEQHTPPSTIVVERSVPAAAPAGGFDWLDAAIGAAFALGIGMLGTAALVATRRRTHGALS
jgi:hypothetical protein